MPFVGINILYNRFSKCLVRTPRKLRKRLIKYFVSQFVMNFLRKDFKEIYTSLSLPPSFNRRVPSIVSSLLELFISHPLKIFSA